MIKVCIARHSSNLFTGTVVESIVFPIYGDIAQELNIIGVTEERVREAFARVFDPKNIEIVFEQSPAPEGEKESLDVSSKINSSI